MNGQRVVVTSWGRAKSGFGVLEARPSSGARTDVLRRARGQVVLTFFQLAAGEAAGRTRVVEVGAELGEGGEEEGAAEVDEAVGQGAWEEDEAAAAEAQATGGDEEEE